MAEMMRLQIVTPDEAFFDGEVSMVELNTADGETGIYPKHIPMVVAVAPGVLKIHGADGVKKAALLSGFLQILPEKVTILAEACEWPETSMAREPMKPGSAQRDVWRKRIHRPILIALKPL